jgi:membrane protein DedA with SNARE-associated domain
MPAVADLAVGIAPIAGGMALGAAAGYLRGPDIRRAIKQDLELLKELPPEQVERRAELQRSIDTRIDDLIAAVNRYRPLRRAAGAYRGSLRDVLLFFCAILFTGVWWSADHHKSNWLPMFVVLILVCVLTAGYALRGLHNLIRRDDRPSTPPQS